MDNPTRLDDKQISFAKRVPIRKIRHYAGFFMPKITPGLNLLLLSFDSTAKNVQKFNYKKRYTAGEMNEKDFFHTIMSMYL